MPKTHRKLTSQNSCGYDAALTILYSLWSENSERWSENFKNLENPYLNALTGGFEHMHTTNISFEAMHENFHYFLQASNRQEFKFLANIFQLQHYLRLYVKD